MCGVWCVVCGVWGVVCGVWGVGCGVWGVGCGVWGAVFGVLGLGCKGATHHDRASGLHLVPNQGNFGLNIPYIGG